MTDAPLPPLESMAALLDAVRRAPPRVHAITSPVAAERTANTLLALGITPSLTVNPQEIPAFIAGSDALLVNLGMLDAERDAAITVAVTEAQRLKRPWVLDPVFADVSPARHHRTRDLLALGPAAIKANARETALADAAPAGTLRIITGAQDTVRLSDREIIIRNGHALGSRVTAMGCALGAVIAAFLARSDDPLTGAGAALLTYALAVEQAGMEATGPGSFAFRFYDCLAALDGAALMQQGRIA